MKCFWNKEGICVAFQALWLAWGHAVDDRPQERLGEVPPFRDVGSLLRLLPNIVDD